MPKKKPAKAVRKRDRPMKPVNQCRTIIAVDTEAVRAEAIRELERYEARQRGASGSCRGIFGHGPKGEAPAAGAPRTRRAARGCRV